MRWSDIPFSPPPKMLRQFAGLWLVFLGGLAAWHGFVRGRPGLAAALATLAVVVGVSGLIYPRAVRPLFVAWMVVAFPIGWTISNGLLGLTYYGLFLPLGLGFRLTGRDALRLRPLPGLESYWVPKPAPNDMRRYFQQF